MENPPILQAFPISMQRKQLCCVSAVTGEDPGSSCSTEAEVNGAAFQKQKLKGCNMFYAL